MMNTVAIHEKKNKKKGMRVSVAVHAIIILLALYPFLTMDSKPDPEPVKFVEIQFTDFKSSSAKSAEGNKKEELEAEKKAEKAKLEDGQTLEHVSTRIKGSLGQKETITYNILDENKEVCGKVILESDTGLKAPHRVGNALRKYDAEDKLIYRTTWLE